MRIIGGRFRGRRLKGPKGGRVRPTPDRVREALFNILGDLADLRVLDLFSGTGAVGLEAASRGADAVLVEKHKGSLAVIRQNVQALGAEVEVVRGDAVDVARRRRDTFDVIFADPPYADVETLGTSLIEAAFERLRPGGTLIVEHDRRTPPPSAACVMQGPKVRSYGDTALSFYVRPEAEVKYTTVTKLAERLKNVAPSATLALTQKARDLKAAGHDVVSLTAGEPDIPPAPHIIEATKAALDAGHTRYTSVSGITELKEAIQKRHHDRDGLEYAINEIVVSAGAKQSLFNAMQALLDPGDEVIIVAPFWLSYRDITCLASGVPVIVHAEEGRGFVPTAEQIKDAITDKTKAIVLNSPSNPTGAVYSKRALEGIADVLMAHPKITIVADEIYRRFSYGGKSAPSILSVQPKLQQRTLIMDGCSKSYSMTGFRIGWTVGPRNVLSAMSRIQGQSTSNPTTISQYAALAAIEGDQSWVDEMVDTFDTRRKFVVGRLNALPGVTCFDPEGAFYVFPNVSGLTGRRTPEGTPIKDATAFTAYLLHDHHLVTVPGKPFGAPNNLRLSFAADMETLSRGLERMQTAIEALQ